MAVKGGCALPAFDRAVEAPESGFTFALLGSGSEGNAAVIRAGRTCLLLDCGFSVKETCARLAQLDLEAADLSGIVVTHEHGDHVRGVGQLARRFDLPVWMSTGTFKSARSVLGELPEARMIDPHEAFAIGDIVVDPFPVPHDAREPCQFVFSDGARRLGFLTDTGSLTAHIERKLDGCDALVLECNHDRDMLWNGDYPPSLKARIGGEHGHLDNETAAELLRRVDISRLKHLVAAHLSRRNNQPARARAALAAALRDAPARLTISEQERVLPWCAI